MNIIQYTFTITLSICQYSIPIKFILIFHFCNHILRFLCQSALFLDVATNLFEHFVALPSVAFLHVYNSCNEEQSRLAEAGVRPAKDRFY